MGKDKDLEILFRGRSWNSEFHSSAVVDVIYDQSTLKPFQELPTTPSRCLPTWCEFLAITVVRIYLLYFQFADDIELFWMVKIQMECKKEYVGVTGQQNRKGDSV